MLRNRPELRYTLSLVYGVINSESLDLKKISVAMRMEFRTLSSLNGRFTGKNMSIYIF